jgi:hypothetical protein
MTYKEHARTHEEITLSDPVQRARAARDDAVGAQRAARALAETLPAADPSPPELVWLDAEHELDDVLI